MSDCQHSKYDPYIRTIDPSDTETARSILERSIAKVYDQLYYVRIAQKLLEIIFFEDRNDFEIIENEFQKGHLNYYTYIPQNFHISYAFLRRQSIFC